MQEYSTIVQVPRVWKQVLDRQHGGGQGERPHPQRGRQHLPRAPGGRGLADLQGGGGQVVLGVRPGPPGHLRHGGHGGREAQTSPVRSSVSPTKTRRAYY